ncbi:MAG: hypothetical protein RJB11_1160 [Planctomycetota bacterium]
MSFFDRFRRSRSKKKARLDENMPRFCFVLCESIEPGDPSAAANAVNKVFGRGYSIDCSDPNIFVVQRQDTTIGFLAHMPAPVPGDEAQNNADENFLWPDGKQEASKHQSHVIVTTFGGEDLSPIESAIELTKLALVALQAFDGLGVYWGGANVCNSRSTFESFSEDISTENLPVPMWLRFQFVGVSEHEIGMYTLGMQQFNLMEIEVDKCKLDAIELFEFVSSIALYLIKSGPVIEDGNTVGGDQNEQILVRHLPSMNEETKSVYKIIFD